MQRSPKPSEANQATREQAGAPNTKRSRGLKVSGLNFGVGLLLISGAILALAAIAYLVLNNDQTVQSNALDNLNARIAEDKYQAVFLDSPDGQVYFGKLAALDNDSYVLSDIYYVQVSKTIQPDTGEEVTSGISLAKLGKELHAPYDTMFIERSQVLFWENIQDDGQVVCAIKAYQKETLGQDVTREKACDERDAETAANAGNGAAAAEEAN